MCAFDVVGLLWDTVGNTNWQAFVLIAIEYYTKWAEANHSKKSRQHLLCRFIMNIITKFGVQKEIITDKYEIIHHKSFPYYPQGNGQAGAINKTLIKIVEKTVQYHDASDWLEKLLEAL